MKASDLALHLRSYLSSHEDCDVKVFCEETVFQECFDPDLSETITDVRVVNDWPLPGESLIIGDSENPDKYLVLFYKNIHV